MSLLLDAMKQSQNTAEPSEPESFEQQQALHFYRRLSMALVAVLAIAAVLSVGYFAGKWWQSKAAKTATMAVVATEPSVQQESAPAGLQETDQSAATEQPPLAATTPAQGQINPNALQMPVQYAQPYQQMVPVYVMPQMPQGYGNGAYMQWVPAYGNQLPANPAQYQASQMQYQANPYSAQQQPIDMSQYKVVGKPMAQSNSHTYNQPQRAEQQFNDAQLSGVSDDLKRAFAEAVAATESMDSSDTVTTATQSSAMAEPIELLPDAIQSKIPSLVYQAHIYATEQDKRWIKLNGYELYEGDSVGRLRVIEITPEKTVLSVDNYEFSLQAMQDWP